MKSNQSPIKENLQYGLSQSQVRSPRTEKFSDTLKLHCLIEDREFEIINLSESGCALKASKMELNQGEEIDLVIKSHNGFKVYSGKSVVTRVFQEEGIKCVGISFKAGLIQPYLIQSLEMGVSIIKEIDQLVYQVNSLPQGFRELVSEYKHYLSLLKEKLDEIDNKIHISSPELGRSFDITCEQIIGPESSVRLRELNLRLNEMMNQFKSKQEKKVAIDFFRHELLDLTHEGKFLIRGWQKPRGYAGDYEMMNQIYRNSLEGKTLFGKVIHYYAINEYASKSVRYRKTYFTQKFKELGNLKKSVHILSIASGPAREIYDFIDQSDAATLSQFHFYLIDQDLEALLESKRDISNLLIEKNKNIKIEFLKISVKNLLEENPNTNELLKIKFDFIYSAGLYDYLTQSVAKIFTETLYKILENGGQLVIGNYHPDNPTKAFQEFICDWQLIHRTKSELLELTEGLPEALSSVHLDPLEIEYFLEIHKNK